MAIKKTIFTAKTVVDSLVEIGTWLTENAKVLGFTLSTESDGSQICSNAKGTNFLRFYNNRGSVGVELKTDGGSTKDLFGNGYPVAWTSGYICSNGIALFAKGSSDYVWVFVNKTESEGTCVIYLEKSRSCFVDIDAGVEIISPEGYTSLSDIYGFMGANASPCTSFTPICFDSGFKAKDLFATAQTQYPMEEFDVSREMIIFDGKDEYVYSGIIAMKG